MAQPKKKETGEKRLMHNLMLAFSEAGARVFRNQVGLAYQGTPIRVTETCRITVEPGDIVLKKARTVKAGLIPGSSDLVGWRSVTITSPMVGKKVALFVACEVKTGRRKLEPEQELFLRVVREAGGIDIEARNIEEAIAGLSRKP